MDLLMVMMPKSNRDRPASFHSGVTLV